MPDEKDWKDMLLYRVMSGLGIKAGYPGPQTGPVTAGPFMGGMSAYPGGEQRPQPQAKPKEPFHFVILGDKLISGAKAREALRKKYGSRDDFLEGDIDLESYKFSQDLKDISPENLQRIIDAYQKATGQQIELTP